MNTLQVVCGVVGGFLMAVIVSGTALCADTPVIARDGDLVRYDTGIVHDTQSGLEWMAGPDRGMTWEQACGWVLGLDAAGGGWRMPSRRELDSLHRIGDGISNITPLLNNSGYWIWAGSTKATSTKWVFSFSYGGEGWGGQAPPDGGRAIAVRNRR
ncbi:MAG: DUF1566 domain-containing protein [Desulfobacterales bacterium]|jgi:hypothetical protein